MDDEHAVVGGVVEGSSATAVRTPTTAPTTAPGGDNDAVAAIERGSRIVQINGQDVGSWYDVHRMLSGDGRHFTLVYQTPDGQTHQSVMALSEEDYRTLRNIRYTHTQFLAERIEPRKTSNPVQAAAWGVIETRDLLLQFYVTLHRLTQGSVSASNFMGPVGIVYSGSLFAFRGFDWLLWFLAMISANLAVVNFLPIPIVDGGLFLFLIVEKIQGRPLSPRTQTVAQLVGLAVILSVFVFVTYQDIWRMFL